MAVWKTQAAVAGAPPVPILFLDRDGVVIRDRDYLADPAGVVLLPGAAAAMMRAREAGFLLVGVSNQSGIGLWDPLRSWVIGDKASDVALGQAAGLGSVLVRTGYGAADETTVKARWPAADRVLVAADLAAAIELILNREGAADNSGPNSKPNSKPNSRPNSAAP